MTKMRFSLTSTAATMDISENAPRDIDSFNNWAVNCGIQTSDGFQLAHAVECGHADVYAITNQDMPEGSPITCIPNEILLTGNKARHEFGECAYEAEQMPASSDDIVPFHLFLKVLKEYELGKHSSWYQWLNSLPRYYSNGASTADFYFGCLPPYAAELALAEKHRLGEFVQTFGTGVFCLI